MKVGTRKMPDIENANALAKMPILSKFLVLKTSKETIPEATHPF